MAAEPTSDREQTYRIGAVSRLTGIPAETLRVWERRYGVVEPKRAGGRFRLYTREDVNRLALLKQLVDAGHAIGSIAHLPIEQLRERFETHAKRGTLVAPEHEQRACRLAVLGEALPARLRTAGDEMSGVELVAVCHDRADFMEAVRESKPDVICLEFPVVNSETVTEIHALLRNSGAARAIVVYGFARQDVVRRLDTAQIEPIRAPANLVELRRACVESARAPWQEVSTEYGVLVTGPIPAPQYTTEALSRIVTASTTVECECPRHLADLINSLRSFEAYSADCESRSPQDSALHAHLHATTAQARAMLEEALTMVVEAEKLSMEID